MAEQEQPPEHDAEAEGAPGKPDPSKSEAGKPGEDKPGAPGQAPKDKKADKRKTTIIVALTAVGVIIAWLTFRKSSSGASTATTSPGSSATNPANYPAASPGVGTVAGYSQGGGYDPTAVNGLAQNISDLTANLQSFESGLPSLLGTTTTTGTGVTSTTSGTTATAHSLPTYTTTASDTLAAIAQRVYGTAKPTAAEENSLRVQNPWLKPIGTTTPLGSTNAGKTITVPVVHG